MSILTFLEQKNREKTLQSLFPNFVVSSQIQKGDSIQTVARTRYGSFFIFDR